MVKGKINHVEFKAPLELDGKGSHWIEISSILSKEIGVQIDVTCSKLHKEDKNPCCINTSLCTVTNVMKIGVLLD